jgi:hypothetical protein
VDVAGLRRRDHRERRRLAFRGGEDLVDGALPGVASVGADQPLAPEDADAVAGFVVGVLVLEHEPVEVDRGERGDLAQLLRAGDLVVVVEPEPPVGVAAGHVERLLPRPGEVVAPLAVLDADRGERDDDGVAFRVGVGEVAEPVGGGARLGVFPDGAGCLVDLDAGAALDRLEQADGAVGRAGVEDVDLVDERPDRVDRPLERLLAVADDHARGDLRRVHAVASTSRVNMYLTFSRQTASSSAPFAMTSHC